MHARTLSYTTRHHGRTTTGEGKRWLDPQRVIRRLRVALGGRYERYRQRETVARLNDRLLDDVGLHRDDFMQAVREPFSRL